MKVENVNVYGLSESVRGAKFPMSVDVSELTDGITKGIDSLGRAEIGSGHDNFLNGILIRGVSYSVQFKKFSKVVRFFYDSVPDWFEYFFL